jgi:hypothetical protein
MNHQPKLSPLPESELTDADLEQVAGGFDPQPDPPSQLKAGVTNPGLASNLPGLKKVAKKSGDPHVNS